MADSNAPKITAGEVAGWPKLQIIYRSDADRIADLLPPGISPGANPNVQLNVYCVPVKGEPEYGVSTKVEADYNGMSGLYSLGMGIDQEAAIFISAELNGQPKFPCSIKFFRLGDTVEARCTHQGYTFMEYKGEVTGALDASDAVIEENEWWTKYSRAVGGAEKQYDFAPHVVRVHSTRQTVHAEELDGTVLLRDSPWDPYTELLPLREQLSAHLVTSKHLSRDITLEGALDPDAFWPHADVIGGSRWPGNGGGPRL